MVFYTGAFEICRFFFSFVISCQCYFKNKKPFGFSLFSSHVKETIARLTRSASGFDWGRAPESEPCEAMFKILEFSVLGLR